VDPETRYARSGEASIAYQVFGDGELELVTLGGPGAHLEVMWEEPLVRRFRERLASFARVAVFDRRCTGLSDPVEGELALEQHMEDLCAVIDAAGFRRPAIYGSTDGARISLLFAATHPDRLSSLILSGASAVGLARLRPEIIETMLQAIEEMWGTGQLGRLFAPSLGDDTRFLRWLGRLERSAASPAVARKLIQVSASADVRSVLPAVRVPTLVLHRRDDTLVPVELGRELAEAIPNAKFVELEGIDNLEFAGDADSILDEIEEFLTGSRPQQEPERVLATVLFTDIVDSTTRAAAVGDRRWSALLDEHHRIVRRELERFRGREVKTTGDGFVATFDGPARAVRGAQEIVRALRSIDVDVRAGLHTGEIEVIGQDIGGLAVHVGARVGALAGPGEVLVSGTVRDLVVGSDLEFVDRGVHELRGVPGAWRLFALEPSGVRSSA
jgi:class 3 adenylate cyclase